MYLVDEIAYSLDSFSEFKKNYLWFLWSRDSNMTQKTNILTIFENIFHYENVTSKLKFWAISSA